MTQTEQQNLTLTVQRTVKAGREEVFDAWTNPAIMQEWFSPEQVTNPSVDVDLRVGGTYRIVMLTPDGKQPIVVGTYREIAAPERLVFTWQWEGESEGMHAGETLVTVEFHERGEATEIVLTHEGLPSDESRTGHGQGWESCLNCLEKALRGSR